ncbi:MAG: hypothetical protein HYT65_03005 [Candidatus Yanofskybacteria bacterium]|nr:hypothetical protein [Candidatus Yanofskybacteria bacterium]
MKPRELNFYRPRKTWLQSRYFYILLPVAVSAGFLILINLNYAKELTITNEPAVALSTNPTPQFTILQKIQEGIELLKKSPSLEYDALRKQVSLAILNKNTGEIFEHRVWVSENEIKNYKKTGTINLETANNNLGVRVNWWNSFNTDYEIPEHPELVVIANKYPFPSSYIIGLPERSAKQYTDIIYAPYSGGLQSPEIIEAGKKYLENNIEQAFAELDAKRVVSLSDARTPVTDNISRDFISNIILVEHIDPDGFNAANDGGKELSERVLTVIGANQGSAYRYTGSPAGASGLAQFIKSTYDLMVLIKNYNAGMADHVNAIKAMVLFFDSHEKDITGKITRRDIVKSLGITEEMLAATYNGGPSRVASSVNKFGLAWFSGQFRLSTAARILRQETLNYVKKFQAIKDLNLFANISAN